MVEVAIIVIHSKGFYKNIGILFFISILFLPFSLNAQTATQDIKKVIISYNQGIIKASKTSKTNHMKAFAKDEIVKKFHLWIKSWHDNNLFMDAKIKKLNFKKIDIMQQKAMVITDEDWLYRYIDIKTKKEAFKQTHIHYNIKYILSKEKEKWLIQKIDILSEKK